MAAATKPRKSKKVKLNGVNIGTYQGSPLLQFFKPDGEPDTWPFQFGPAKAKKMCQAIENNGLVPVLEKLYEVAGIDCPFEK